MVYVAAIEAVALVAVALAFAGVVRSLVRQQARERMMLLDRLMHLSGQTWTPPPIVEPEPVEDEYVDFGLTGSLVESDYQA